MSSSPLFQRLEKALRCLPGVGPKGASRMALHLIERNREGGLALANALRAGIEGIENCNVCSNLTETQPCAICSDPGRSDTLLCVISSPADILTIEQSDLFKGRYHCLKGLLSPLDGLGPQEIGLPALIARIQADPPDEVLIALAATIEGEATTHQIGVRIGGITKVTRLAQGLPVGGELDQIDMSTLAQALMSRNEVSRE